MYDKVIFFNHGHLGDTLISKHFISEIKKLIKSKSYAISNRYDYNYICDVVDEHIPLDILGINSDVWYSVSEDNKILYFNTWYGILCQSSFLDKIGVRSNLIDNFRYDDGVLYNWENYIFYFSLTLKLINDDLNLFHMLDDKIKYVLPLAKLDKLQIPFINDDSIKILIYNQIATSGQADNVDFSKYIEELLTSDKNITIYTSQQVNVSKKFTNLVELSNYITYPDLFKITELSTKCNFICGPGNAPLQLTWVSENLLDFNKTYITINRNNIGEAMLLKETNCKNIVVRGTQELFEKLKIELNKI